MLGDKGLVGHFIENLLVTLGQLLGLFLKFSSISLISISMVAIQLRQSVGDNLSFLRSLLRIQPGMGVIERLLIHSLSRLDIFQTSDSIQLHSLRSLKDLNLGILETRIQLSSPGLQSPWVIDKDICIIDGCHIIGWRLKIMNTAARLNHAHVIQIARYGLNHGVNRIKAGYDLQSLRRTGWTGFLLRLTSPETQGQGQQAKAY